MLRQDEILVRLSKRIGYSAGLDNLPNRIKRLIDFFVDHNLTAPLLKEFIKGDGLSGKSQETFILILKQLDMISTAVTGAVFPNTNFVLLKNIRKMFKNDDDFDFASTAILFEILLKQDGDVLANLMECKFQTSISGETLSRMAFQKYTLLSKIYPSSIIKLNIWNQIKFGLAKTSRFDLIKEEGFENLSSVEKLSQPRKSWLRNFGIFEKEEIIQDHLEKLRKLNNFEKNNNCHLFWPEHYELTTFRITNNFVEEYFENKFINICNETILKSRDIKYQEVEISKKDMLKELDELLLLHEKIQIPWDIFIRMLNVKYLILGKIIKNIDLSIEELRKARKINLVNLVGRGGALKLQK